MSDLSLLSDLSVLSVLMDMTTMITLITMIAMMTMMSTATITRQMNLHSVHRAAKIDEFPSEHFQQDDDYERVSVVVG